MLVFVEGATEVFASSYVEVASSSGSVIGAGSARSGQARDALVLAMVVVELLELAEGVDQVPPVPDQDAIQELAAAGLHPRPPGEGTHPPRSD